MPSAATAALLQNTMRSTGDGVGHALDRTGRGVHPEHAAVGVADEQPAVEVDLDAERPAAGVGDAVELPAVVGDPEDAAVLGAGEDRALVAAVRADDDVLGAGGGNRDHVEAHGSQHRTWLGAAAGQSRAGRCGSGRRSWSSVSSRSCSSLAPGGLGGPRDDERRLGHGLRGGRGAAGGRGGRPLPRPGRRPSSQLGLGSDVDEYLAALQDAPWIATPLATTVAVSEDAPVRRARRGLVGLGRGRVGEGAPLNVYRLDDDVDLGAVADALADAGLEESDLDGHRRFKVGPDVPMDETGMVDGIPVQGLPDVTVLEDAHLLVAGAEPERVVDVVDGDADALADQDGLAALTDRTGAPLYAVAFLGADALCDQQVELLAPPPRPRSPSG